MPSLGRRSNQVYETVKQRLLDGEYGSGQPVIRQKIGHRTCCQQEPREIADFFRLVTVVEGLCARLAAERADAAGAARLAQINAEIGQLLRQDSDDVRKQSYRRLNHVFHAQVHTLAQSAPLAAIAQGLWDRVDFYIGTALSADMFTISVPSPQRMAAIVNTLFPDLCGEHWTEPVPPEPYGFMADIDATLKQQILNLSQRKRMPDVHHDREADYLG